MFRYVDGGGGGGMALPHGGGGGVVWLVCCARSWSVGGGCGVYILAFFGGVRCGDSVVTLLVSCSVGGGGPGCSLYMNQFSCHVRLLARFFLRRCAGCLVVPIVVLGRRRVVRGGIVLALSQWLGMAGLGLVGICFLAPHHFCRIG